MMTREEAKAYIIRHCNPDYPEGKTEWETAINMAIKALEQPERKKGKWIDRGEEHMLRWVCSECGRKDTHIYNFCPDCGLDTRGDEHETD